MTDSVYIGPWVSVLLEDRDVSANIYTTNLKIGTTRVFPQAGLISYFMVPSSRRDINGPYRI